MAEDQEAGTKNRKLHNYKQLKEAHVANLSGGSIWEINEVTLVLPVSLNQFDAKSWNMNADA